MKKMLILSLLAGTLVGFTGCSEDEKVGKVPVYGDITVSENIYTGQNAEAKVSYVTPGAYVLHADCNYSVTKGSKTWDSGSWRIVAPEDNEPTFKFKAPREAGTYRISFKAKFSFYADLANGTIFGQSNTVDKNFVVNRADAVDACWGDTRDHLNKVLTVSDTLSADGEKLKYYAGNVCFNTDTLTIEGMRFYHFDADSTLVKVEEIAEFELTRVSSPVENENGDIVNVYDSIANKKAFPYLFDITKMDGYDPVGEPRLTGTSAELYPVEEWSYGLSDREKANIINAFWHKNDNGEKQLEKYEQIWRSDVTQCTVSVSEKDDKLVFKRCYVPCHFY